MPQASAPKHSSARIVVKIGSNVLALPGGGLDLARIASIAREVADLRVAGIEVILVSSGAVAAGRAILRMEKRPSDIAELQAAAAAGQGALMAAYIDAFRPFGIAVAQMLLTHGDMEDRRRYLNIRNALRSLLAHGVVPIINENDTVTIDELKFGDNDMLSAIVAAKVEAQRLIILSSIPGLLDRANGNAVLREVPRIDASIEALVSVEKTSLGTGGMGSKLSSARHATRFGVEVTITDGRAQGAIARALAGEAGTRFPPRPARGIAAARLHWISTRRPKGVISIDAGATAALRRRKSLLPVGALAVTGAFGKGDVVSLCGPDGSTVALGVTNFASTELPGILGRKGAELRAILGEARYEEIVHCDNLFLLEDDNG